MTSEFGKWLKTRLIELGMSQKELAKAIGTTECAVSLYVTGKRNPSRKRMMKIQEILGDVTKAREIPRSITLRQLLYYMTDSDVIQLCFEDDGWDSFTELKGNSKLLTPLIDRRIVCMGAEESANGQAIRVTIKGE